MVGLWPNVKDEVRPLRSLAPAPGWADLVASEFAARPLFLGD